ncbi:MAG: Uncharacterised protein [Synechococcus sp. MIT S9220]|nr:MAG: Uncharacterised protein [Synechococcus sp. MIT S9220]
MIVVFVFVNGDLDRRPCQLTDHCIGVSTMANDEVIQPVLSTSQLGGNESNQNAPVMFVGQVQREGRHGSPHLVFMNDVRIKGDAVGALAQA